MFPLYIQEQAGLSMVHAVVFKHEQAVAILQQVKYKN